MRLPLTANRRLACAAILAVLLVGCRLALATHPFEHDLAAPDVDCEQCEVAHFPSDGALVDDRPQLDALEVEPARLRTDALALVEPWCACLPRAPPIPA